MIRRQWVVLLIILSLAGALRLLNLAAPPTDFHPTRQFNSALITRAFLVDLRGAPTEAKRQIAEARSPAVAVPEPPVIESLTVAVALLIGHESLVVPRLVSIAAWLWGGVALFLIGRRLMSERGALLAAALFELMPIAVIASRSFQPDPLAVSALLTAILASARWVEKPRLERFGVAVGAGALAAFLKVDFMPFVLAGHAGLSWSGEVTRPGLRPLLRPAQIAYVALCFLPALCWPPYALLRIGSSGDKSGGYFIPHLLVTGQFWINLGRLLDAVYGWPLLILAVSGLLFAGRRLRCVLMWAALAIATYTVAFDYRVETHSYYQLPIVPFVCLGLAATADRGIAWVGGVDFPKWLKSALAVCTAAIATVAIVKNDRPSPEKRSAREIALYERIGTALCHPEHAILVSSAYGNPLAYYGYIGGISWPSSADVALSDLMGQPLGGASQLLASYRVAGSRYVIATDFSPFEFGDDLKVALSSYPQVLGGDGYKVWDLRPGEPSGCSGGPT